MLTYILSISLLYMVCSRSRGTAMCTYSERVFAMNIYKAELVLFSFLFFFAGKVAVVVHVREIIVHGCVC